MINHKKPTKQYLDFLQEAKRMRKIIHLNPGISNEKLRAEYRKDSQVLGKITPGRPWVEFRTVLEFLVGRNYVQRNQEVNKSGNVIKTTYSVIPL